MSAVIVGASKNPFENQVVSALSEAVNTIEEITEAHVPQWFEPINMEPLEQVLVVVIKKRKNPNKVMPKLMQALAERLPTGLVVPSLHIYENDPLLEEIRQTDTRLSLEPKSPSFLGRLFQETS